MSVIIADEFSKWTDRYTSKWSKCTRCSLYESTRTRPIMRGRIPFDVLLVGEAPGESEDLLGEPFVGQAGKLLDHILSHSLGSGIRVSPVDHVFVFGSNREGRHGKGAALAAKKLYRAEYGKCEGMQGRSYAIVTKELRKSHPAVTVEEVREGVQRFISFAESHPNISFEVSPIGCGLAGFSPSQIAPMFHNVPDNVFLPSEFIVPKVPYLITNCVVCTPPREEGRIREPFRPEKESCRGHIQELVSKFKPKVIVSLGRHAHQSLSWITHINLIHPAAILRYPERKADIAVKQLINSLRKAVTDADLLQPSD